MPVWFGGLLIVWLALWLPVAQAQQAAVPLGPGSEQVPLGNGVEGLRIFGEGDHDDQSLLVADAGLLGLALPEWREEFDELVFRSGRDKPLLVLITALEDGAWESSMSFSQGASRVETRHPFRLKVVGGSPEAVGPHAPVVAVALLPPQFDLRRPIHVEWAGNSGTITFRR